MGEPNCRGDRLRVDLLSGSSTVDLIRKQEKKEKYEKTCKTHMKNRKN